MGVFQVGRVAADAPLDGLRQIEHGGDRVQVDVDASMGTLSSGVAVRQQSLGLVDGDELVVPVWWDGDSSVDGFYEPLDVSVTPDPHRYVSSGHVRVAASLRRVQGFAAPLFESVLLGAKRASTAAPAQAYHAVPATAKGYETGVLTPYFDTVSSETGNVLVLREVSNVFFNARAQYFLKARDWYVGASTLKVGGATVIGQQAANLPDQWVLSNGIVRLVAKTGGWFQTQRWSGSAWSAAGEWTLGRYISTGSTFTALEAPHTITVMRNTPQSVIVRLTSDAVSAVPTDRFAVTVDIELRRGATLADVYLTARGSQRWAVRTPLTYSSATAHTGGHSQGGYLVAYQSTSAQQAVGTALVATAGGNSTFLNVGVGHPFVGSFPEQDAISMWTAVQSENVIVAAR